MINPSITITEHMDGDIVAIHNSVVFHPESPTIHMLDYLADTKPTSSFSFSLWPENIRDKHLTVSTALTLEYDARQYEAVTQALFGIECAFFLIPTHHNGHNRILIMMPIQCPATQQEAKRAAQLMAQYIEATGLIKDSWLSTAQFQIRPDLPTHFIDGDILDAEQIVQNGFGILTKTHQFTKPH